MNPTPNSQESLIETTATAPVAPAAHAIAEPISTTVPMIIYVLYLVNLLIPLTGVVGIIMAYINKGDAPEVLKSHYQYAIRTFWIGILYGFVGIILTTILIGWLILLFTVIWLIVRCIKGIQLLGKQQPVPNPTSWMFG